MTDKPTYKELEKQIAELKKQIAFDNEKKSKFEAELLNEIKRRHEIEYNLSKYKSLFEAVIKQAPFAAHVIEGSFNNLKVLLDNDESRRIMDESFEDTSVIDADKSDMLKTRFFSTDGKTEIPLKLMPSPRAFKGEIVTNEEFLFRHASGKEIFVEANAFPIFDETQNIIAVVVTFHDISERKKTEQALRESEARFTAFMNNLPVSAFIKDKLGRNIYFNNHLINLMGFNNWENKLNDELIPDNVAIKVNEDDRIALEGSIHSFTEEMKGADGVVRIFHTIKFPIFTENKGTMLGGISVDITERKQIEQALKDSETKFKEIINQINDGIVVFDEQSKIVIFNKGAEQIFDLKAENVLNNSIVDIQYQFAPSQFKDKTLIENVIKGIVTLQTPELFDRIIDNETLMCNGNIKNIQSIVFPIKFENFNLFCSVFRDTTEIKEYEKQLLQLNADKDRFIAILAHDLRSPFNSILGFLNLLTENIRKYDIDKIEKQINIVNNSAKNTFRLL